MFDFYSLTLRFTFRLPIFPLAYKHSSFRITIVYMRRVDHAVFESL